MMVKDPAKFKSLVEESLRRHVAAINTLAERGLQFWDYGNSLYVQYHALLLMFCVVCWRLAEHTPMYQTRYDYFFFDSPVVT